MLLSEVKPLDKPTKCTSAHCEDMEVFEPRPPQSPSTTEPERSLKLVMIDAGADAVLRAHAFDKIDRLAILCQTIAQCALGESD